MSKNLCEVNMVLFIICILLTGLGNSYCFKEEFVPTMVWTSEDFNGRKNVDYLALKKIKSELFESNLIEVLGGKKPLIVVFLEEELGTDDFDFRDKNGENSFPFLSTLTVNSRVDYFRSVESPYKTVGRLSSKGYRNKRVTPGKEFDLKEGNLLTVEFGNIKGQRPEAMKNHDRQMEEFHRLLIDSGTSWISIYTGKEPHNRNRFSHLRQMSPWHVEEQVQEKSSRAISLYLDDFTGYALITKGSLRLFLPSPKNPTLKILENYLAASAKPLKDAMDFSIWFSNYTLTFHLQQSEGSWTIKSARLSNRNGDALNLTLRQEIAFLKNKCYFQLTEFQSEGKPFVKVVVSKYKFLQLDLREEPFTKPYGFKLTFFLIIGSILFAVVCWNRLLQKWDFSRKSKIINISLEKDKAFS